MPRGREKRPEALVTFDDEWLHLVPLTVNGEVAVRERCYPVCMGLEVVLLEVGRVGKWE